MRYYNFTLATTTEYIEANTKTRLKDHSYDNTISAVNAFMYKYLKNNITFFIYREDENALQATFSYDDTKGSFQAAYDFVTGMLTETFLIKRISAEPEEITMYQFMDNLVESRRHDFMQGLHRIREISNLWIYDVYNGNTWDELHYDFEEKIIVGSTHAPCGIYDKSLLNELCNIDTYVNDTGLSGNPFHYVISARSMEAVEDITECLMQRLIKAKRISSRRMEIIRDMAPEVYNRSNNHLEEILENNVGGVIVFDLTERFGQSPTSYGLLSKYLVNLLKNYRNKCLFVFTYNMDHPGFSFQVLSEIQKYVIPVMLREGTGDRKAAVKYMKTLIGKSDYARFSNKAGEFMKFFPGNDFSQTDVLNAYAKFDAWCLCTQVMHIPYNPSDDFMLDRDENAESAYEKLQNLIGLDIVKKQIDEIIANNIVEKERKLRADKKMQSPCMHMVFAGNPGSAKTTVANLFAGIGKEKGILKSGAFVVRGGMDLDGPLGPVFIQQAFAAAKGGVLFIDEAYSLKHDVAMTTLIQEMENKREDVIVILAGYNDRMKKFMEQNEGMKSRVPYWVDFPDYTEDELMDIFKLMIKERGFTATEKGMDKVRYIFSKVCCLDNFGNGRYVRNLMENAIRKQSVRILPEGEDTGSIKKKDLFLLDADDITVLEEGLTEEREYGTAAKELNQLIGLTAAKDVIRKAVAGFKMNKRCIDMGIPRDKASYHMVFTGNPGTAKTTVARLLAEILKDEKVLGNGNFVEVGRADLVSEYVGKTASLVKSKFREAQGGVLFIDEAYSLCDYHKNSYGDEAINTIVQEMENNRDKVIVIFAGYPEPMKEFLERNPGMSSRIAFHINFEDYSVDELCDITKLMLSKKQYEITDAAMDRLCRIYENVSRDNDYGNGRFVRKLIEEAEMNLALRLENVKNSDITKKILTTIEAEDIPAVPVQKRSGVIRIGFAN